MLVAVLAFVALSLAAEEVKKTSEGTDLKTASSFYGGFGYGGGWGWGVRFYVN